MRKRWYFPGKKCVNINPFVPGYSSRLCGNCGSSKWRRVFTWTAVEQFQVLCLSELRKLERFKHTLVVRDVTTSVAHLRICASAPSPLCLCFCLWSVRLRWVALSIAVGLRRVTSCFYPQQFWMRLTVSLFSLSLVTRTWSHSQRIRVGSRYRAGEKTRCKKENLFFQSQMDESNPLEEMKTWEHPPWYGSDQFEARFSWKIRRVSSTTSGLVSGCRVKRWMSFGPCQETSHTAITLNPESNFTRREKNPYSTEIHWRNPELLIRIWMSSKRNASMIVGISIGSRYLSDPWTGFHSIYSIGRKTSRRIHVVRGEN